MPSAKRPPILYIQGDGQVEAGRWFKGDGCLSEMGGLKEMDV
jgi:hypothetical protein